MTAVDFLLALSQQFEADTITVQPAACLNARFRAAGCTRCADICPAEAAITVTNGHPAIDNDACLHCGLCLHRCPTGAFTRPDGFSRKLARTAAAVPTGPVELVCPQHPAPTFGQAPYAIQTRRCLAAISAATLLALTAVGKDILLDDRHCADCPLGVVQPHLAHITAEANSWAALLADAGTVRLQGDQPDAPAATRPVLDATQPPVSRRGLFSVFKSHNTPATDTQTEATELIKPGRDIAPSDRLPHALPPERAAVLNTLAQHSPSEAIQMATAQLPVIDIQIDPTRCTACGLCAKFCPTGALKFLRDGESFALTFRADYCLGQHCNICQPACPEQAVTTAPATTTPTVLAKRALTAGDLGHCDRCHSPIARGPGLPATCFACRPRHNAADLFASFS
jgi:ferredoxin